MARMGAREGDRDAHLQHAHIPQRRSDSRDASAACETDVRAGGRVSAEMAPLSTLVDENDDKMGDSVECHVESFSHVESQVEPSTAKSMPALGITSSGPAPSSWRGSRAFRDARVPADDRPFPRPFLSPSFLLVRNDTSSAGHLFGGESQPLPVSLKRSHPSSRRRCGRPLACLPRSDGRPFLSCSCPPSRPTRRATRSRLPPSSLPFASVSPSCPAGSPRLGALRGRHLSRLPFPPPPAPAP